MEDLLTPPRDQVSVPVDPGNSPVRKSFMPRVSESSTVDFLSDLPHQLPLPGPPTPPPLTLPVMMPKSIEFLPCGCRRIAAARSSCEPRSFDARRLLSPPAGRDGVD